MPRLLLVRHGQIQANVDGHWHGSTDSALTATGRRQAKRLARALARDYGLVDALYSSPLQRCALTAGALARVMKLPVELHPELREYDLGAWDGLPFQTLRDAHDFFRLSTKDPDFRPPGGESLADVAVRIVSTLRSLDQSVPADGSVAVVAHGALLGVALATLVDANPALWGNYHIDNCSLTEITLEPEVVVHRFNELLFT